MNSRRTIASTLVLFICTALFAQKRSDHGHEHQLYQLGDHKLESDVTLPNAFILYVTHGNLNSDSSNVILLQTAFGGTHYGYDFLLEPVNP